jgi:hypothetical protein
VSIGGSIWRLLSILLDHAPNLRISRKRRDSLGAFVDGPTTQCEAWAYLKDSEELWKTIILRDRDGYLVDYRDNRDIRRMRKRLDALNEGLVTQEIAVKDRVIREGDRLENGGRARAQLHRVFNRGSFDLGGRFYGGHWQNIPSIGGRDEIKIDGKATTEIDMRQSMSGCCTGKSASRWPAIPTKSKAVPASRSNSPS